jgi:hypothetical protein
VPIIRIETDIKTSPVKTKGYILNNILLEVSDGYKSIGMLIIFTGLCTIIKHSIEGVIIFLKKSSCIFRSSSKERETLLLLINQGMDSVYSKSTPCNVVPPLLQIIVDKHHAPIRRDKDCATAWK